VTPEEARRRLVRARVGRLATVRRDGSPHVVPFVFAIVEIGSEIRAYWIVDDKPKRSPFLRRIENIETNPSVEFVIDEYWDDWDRLWWVRASGTGRVVHASNERAMALEALGEKYPQYRGSPHSGAVVAIDIERISAWEAGAG